MARRDHPVAVVASWPEDHLENYRDTIEDYLDYRLLDAAAGVRRRRDSQLVGAPASSTRSFDVAVDEVLRDESKEAMGTYYFEDCAVT